MPVGLVNIMKNLITVFLTIALLIFGGLACQNLPFAKKTEQPENSGNYTYQTPGNTVNDSTAGDNSVTNDSSGSKTISGGVLNGKATNLVKPAYPPAAKAARASGAVNVQVTVDEKGDVVAASAVSGHPLLRASAVQAARQSKFSPTLLSGKPVKVTGVIVYNFTLE